MKVEGSRTADIVKEGTDDDGKSLADWASDKACHARPHIALADALPALHGVTPPAHSGLAGATDIPEIQPNENGVEPQRQQFLLM